tara:strand:+ start:347 stop:1225 length:879 start_codon:yes stop_codon:yes gene_type:complete
MAYSTAGILPYMIDPQTSEMYVVLGKECTIEGWEAGSNKWCSLAGKREYGETEFATAAREFYEESMGVIPTYNCRFSTKMHDIEFLKHELANDEYWMRLFVQVTKNCSKGRVLFIKKVPWTPNLPTLFEEFRQVVEPVRQQLELAHQCAPTTISFLNPFSQFETCMWMTGATQQSSHIIQVTWTQKCGGSLSMNVYASPQEVLGCVQSFKMLQEAKRMFLALLPARCHMCFRIEWYNRELIKLDWRPEYFEKQALGIWSISQLKQVLESGGLNFRETFLFVIEALLEALCRD